MSREQWTAVDEYLGTLFVGEDEALEAALEASSTAGLPPISVSATQGKLLQLLIEVRGAKNVLEIGTLGGYSAIWMARGLPADGRLVTLEVDSKHAEVARSNVARAGLAPLVEVVLGPAAETLPKLAADGRGPFDLVFIDADKTGYPEYLRWSTELTRRGSLIIADNVVRNGAVADAASKDVAVQAVRRYHELVAADPRLEATVIQTVGVKGYDGFGVALVTDGRS